MDRRALLKLFGTSALAFGPVRSLRAWQRPASRVVVIGAGIIGAGIGYELAKRGADVTILEKRAPASGATGDSFAYLNASTKASAIRPYFDLNWQGIAGWHAWQGEPGAEFPVSWGGSIYWRDQPEPTEALLATLATVSARGYRSERLDAARIRGLLPGVTNVADVSVGALYEEEGAVDPVGVVEALLSRARQHGASVVYPAEVVGLRQLGGRIVGVRTSQGELQADTVVIAAGAGSQSLLASVDVRLPLQSSHGVLLHTAPQPQLLDRVVFAPGSTFRQNLDGRIISSAGHEGTGLDDESADEVGRRIRANAARYLPAIRDAEIDRVTVGQRVIPGDTLPVVGFAPRVGQLYVSVTHSGVTLAPAIATLAAQEILEGLSFDQFASFRPDRFQT